MPKMKPVEFVRILPFEPENQVAVKELILSGLVEHWGWLDPTKNPDLEDIAAHYADGLFLVAWHHQELIGCGALIPRSAKTAEIVRMSVAKTWRRQGIGRLILQQLCDLAQDQGYTQVVLETTASWQAVIQFYLSYGFRITHFLDDDVYFALDLTERNHSIL